MQPNSVAIFLSAQPKNRANDVDYEYHQDPNFFYLTGHLQANAALVLLANPIDVNGISTNEILFVERSDPAREVWTGKRLGTKGAKSVLGFSVSFIIDSLPSFLAKVLVNSSTIYYEPPASIKYSDKVSDTSINIRALLIVNLKKTYSKEIGSLSKRLAELRMIKTPEELVLLRKAIDITCKAHNEIMRKVKPGWYEYQMQALGEFIFKQNGCEYTGYPCIVGSGDNSTILHYITNRRKTEDGDFIEMDIGGEYHGYTADVTRSFPVNGKFTPAQRTIYDLVLEAQDSGIVAARVGNIFKAPHEAAVSVIKRGLLKLGIITDGADYKKYFMHGTSHYLGLDVHDAGTGGLLAENEVITVEPGIYIAEGSPCDRKWWKIGCRIEDDILIQKNHPEILSINSPRKADDVIKLMKEK
jgi:Xaa-Pro aminopeptidase